MFRKTIIAAGVLASCVAFSQGALAAAASVTQSSNADTYAQETFGAGSDATVLASTAANVVLTIGGTVDAGEAADFTVTLSNAQFGASVPLSAMAYSASATGAVTITKQSGGAAGDSSVVFRITVAAGGALANTDTLTFTVPSLTSASGLELVTALVNATTSIEQISTSGVDTFPTSITGATGANILIAGSADEITLTVGAGNDATIDVAARADVTTNAVAITSGLLTLDGIEVGSVLVSIDASVGNIQASDGLAYNVTAGNDGEGDVTITVSGVGTGDVVFADLNDDQTIDTGESLTITSGTGSLAVDTQVLLTAAAAAGGGIIDVYVVVDGTTIQIPSNYVLTATTSFDSGTGLVETDTTTTSTSYSGLVSDGWSLAIPNSANADIANIRVTNETSVTNTLFAQCFQQDGTAMGFEEVASLAANETKVLKATDLEAVFGTWTGRARCDFSRSGNISVQTMVRSGGILNNLNGSTGVETNDAANITR
jgi:hypothetical protein